MPVEVKPDYGGLPFNPEPATDPKITRQFSFTANGQLFSLLLEVPLYIWDKLKSSDWDQVEKWVRERAESIRLDEARAGNLLRWTEKIQEFARTCIYTQFSKAQQQAGNAGWAVPEGW